MSQYTRVTTFLLYLLLKCKDQNSSHIPMPSLSFTVFLLYIFPSCTWFFVCKSVHKMSSKCCIWENISSSKLLFINVSQQLFLLIPLMYYSLHLVHYSLHLMHYSLHLVHYSLQLVHYSLHLVHYSLHLMYYSLHLVHYSLHLVHYSLQLVHYSLHLVHYSLHLVHISPNIVLFFRICMRTISHQI